MVVARLVGKKCKVSCVLNGVPVEALWDTGAQVSIVSKSWLEEYLPSSKLRNIEELLGEDVGLNLTTANGGTIPFEGWVEVQFQLSSDTESSSSLTVPFLIARDELETPIIGYNVIEEVVKDRETEGSSSIVDIMNTALKGVALENVTALVDLVQNASIEDMGVLKNGKRNLTVPRGQAVTVPCRINCGSLEERTPMLFEPDPGMPWPADLEVVEQLPTLPRGSPHRVNITVRNPSKHDVVLGRRTLLGHLQLVQSVTPLEVVRKDLPRSEAVDPKGTGGTSLQDGNPSVPQHQVNREVANERKSFKTPAVVLGDLTESQRQLAMTMLEEEAASFSQDDDDMGRIEGLQLNLELSDTTPVQKSYFSIPRPLYAEVKHYIEDLLNRGWITKSQSNYSSPMVCVRKKDGGLRLCVDYRELNRKTVPDRHPIPRIQETLDNLGGNSWFSVLDQGKAYHQGFVGEKSRHLTAFITPWGLYEWTRIHLG